jgi:hypothetical protein
MSGCDKPTEEFRYKRSLFAPLYVGFLGVLLLLWLGVYLYSIELRVIGIIFFVFGVLIFGVIILIHLAYATIRIDDEAIRACQFGRVWRLIKWCDIKRALLMNEYDPAFSSVVSYYYINDSMRRQRFQSRKIFANTKYGSLMFSGKINNLDKLLNIVNGHLIKHGVDTASVDQPKNARDAIEREQKITAL